ncbi:uncharacterized protein [Manis javanica]|uniref:uncharacterized protein isoform X6 n=1 Tax=Manis javanica TaxID=9974 RepID=UPI003C6D68D7
MTRASRPTFEAARGGRGKGEGDLSQLSKQHSSRDLPYTKIKYRRKMKMKILKRRVMMMVLQLYLQNWKELKKKELKSRPGSTCHHLLHMLNVCHPIFQRLTQNSQRCSVIHIKKSKNQLILQHRTTKTNLTGWHRSYLPQEESGGGQWRRRACADLGRASALPLPPGPQRPRRSRLAAPPSSERPREH